MKSDYRRAKVLRLSISFLRVFPRTFIVSGKCVNLRNIVLLVDGLIERELLPKDATPTLVWEDYNPPGMHIMLHSEVFPEIEEELMMPDVIEDDVLSRETWAKALDDIMKSLGGYA